MVTSVGDSVQVSVTVTVTSVDDGVGDGEMSVGGAHSDECW